MDTDIVNVNVPPPSRANANDFTGESWDTIDVGPVGYNPELASEKVLYVRMKNHLSRGAQNAWKAQEHERIRRLLEQQAELEEKERQKENKLPLPPGLPPLEAQGAAALPPKKNLPPKKAPMAPKPNGKEILRIILVFLSKLCCCCGALKCFKGEGPSQAK